MENPWKPFEQMDDMGGFPTCFGNTLSPKKHSQQLVVSVVSKIQLTRISDWKETDKKWQGLWYMQGFRGITGSRSISWIMTSRITQMACLQRIKLEAANKMVMQGLWMMGIMNGTNRLVWNNGGAWFWDDSRCRVVDVEREDGRMEGVCTFFGSATLSKAGKFDFGENRPPKHTPKQTFETDHETDPWI